MTVGILLLMGVSGSGKTTIGELLAERLGWTYADADSFHSPADVAKMASGQPLTDADRAPWLDTIAAWIERRLAAREPGIISCSALKRSYRDLLRRPGVRFVYLHGTRSQIEARLVARQGHFFKEHMLDTQLSLLEEPAADEHIFTVSVELTPTEIVKAILLEMSNDR